MSDHETQSFKKEREAVLQLQQTFLHICRRILEINEECSVDLGCPYQVVVMPMITEWRLRNIRRLQSPSPALNRALRGIISATSNSEHTCEISEVKTHARVYIGLIRPIVELAHLRVDTAQQAP